MKLLLCLILLLGTLNSFADAIPRGQFPIFEQYQDLCVYGGWPSKLQSNSCPNPATLRDRNGLSEFGESYSSRSCTSNNQMNCNPTIFGDIGCVNIDRNNKSLSLTKNCIAEVQSPGQLDELAIMIEQRDTGLNNPFFKTKLLIEEKCRNQTNEECELLLKHIREIDKRQNCTTPCQDIYYIRAPDNPRPSCEEQIRECKERYPRIVANQCAKKCPLKRMNKNQTKPGLGFGSYFCEQYQEQFCQDDQPEVPKPGGSGNGDNGPVDPDHRDSCVRDIPPFEEEGEFEDDIEIILNPPDNHCHPNHHNDQANMSIPSDIPNNPSQDSLKKFCINPALYICSNALKEKLNYQNANAKKRTALAQASQDESGVQEYVQDIVDYTLKLEDMREETFKQLDRYSRLLSNESERNRLAEALRNCVASADPDNDSEKGLMGCVSRSEFPWPYMEVMMNCYRRTNDTSLNNCEREIAAEEDEIARFKTKISDLNNFKEEIKPSYQFITCGNALEDYQNYHNGRFGLHVPNQYKDDLDKDYEKKVCHYKRYKAKEKNLYNEQRTQMANEVFADVKEKMLNRMKREFGNNHPILKNIRDVKMNLGKIQPFGDPTTSPAFATYHEKLKVTQDANGRPIFHNEKMANHTIHMGSFGAYLDPEDPRTKNAFARVVSHEIGHMLGPGMVSSINRNDPSVREPYLFGHLLNRCLGDDEKSVGSNRFYAEETMADFMTSVYLAEDIKEAGSFKERIEILMSATQSDCEGYKPTNSQAEIEDLRRENCDNHVLSEDSINRLYMATKEAQEVFNCKQFNGESSPWGTHPPRDCSQEMR